MKLVGPGALVFLAVACTALAIAGVSQHYSDAQIQASVVDTWEVSALFTLIVMGFSGVVALSSLAILHYSRGSRAVRRLALATLVLSVVAVSVGLSAHVALTLRTTALTGQEFGGFYGLW
jgi:hypothetical protein